MVKEKIKKSSSDILISTFSILLAVFFVLFVTSLIDGDSRSDRKVFCEANFGQYLYHSSEPDDCFIHETRSNIPTRYGIAKDSNGKYFLVKGSGGI